MCSQSGTVVNKGTIYAQLTSAKPLNVQFTSARATNFEHHETHSCSFIKVHKSRRNETKY
jgi:hypothetical protein